ncbi:peptide/nickel transport system substrate-binding protein [Thermocatellispora tengchongensis]|uniref:Peptide/nickel transport system substrate-binding protein n=1 Tax=Thermocatellispora tengchongensis TaxID=1073253 RepID=A0A840PMN6_9ACTN|nr:ABC transporter substrate-binding protein [Thermocatellispora tengchongensis]MBB5138940.1 peptide/nickel transport system substrate-binding protein [Thermocatellispora tengchongensis]
MKRLATFAALMAIVTATATACGGAAATDAGAEVDVYTTIDGTKQINASAPINPFNPVGSVFTGYNGMALAWARNHPTDPNRFYPALARSWTQSPDGAQVDIHLQPEARWSDGKPVTSEDVRVSIGLAYTQGGTAYALDPKAAGAAADVRVLDAKTIRVTQGANRSAAFLANLLSTVVVPAHVYGALLPRGFWDTLKVAQHDRGPAGERAKAVITGLADKVIAFSPEQDVSAGPFVLERVNPGAALLRRNPYFYNSRAIGPDKVKVLNYTGNEQIWNYLISGQLDNAPFTSVPAAVMERIRGARGSQVITGYSPVATSLAFNQSHKPYDNVHVRRALAYLIDREQVTRIAAPEGGTPAATTSGIHAKAARAWLGDGFAELEPYRLDPAKAAAELRAAGMKLRDGRWTMPDGSPWKVEIHVPASFSDWVSAAKSISSGLGDHGIDATVLTAADYSLYLSELAKGEYDLGFWLIGLGPSPYNIFQRLFGQANGWQMFGGRLTHVPPGTGGNWMGGPRTVEVAGEGLVDPGELTSRLNYVSPGEQRRIVGVLARIANEQLPAVQLWDYVNTQFVNTSRYTGFPPDDSEMLRLSSGVWMQLGMIRKRQP